MSTENKDQIPDATEGCAAAAGYVAEPLKIVQHQFRPTTGVKAADDYIRQAVADVMRELTPLIVERVTDKMALLLEAKKLPRRSHTAPTLARAGEDAEITDQQPTARCQQ